MQMMDARNVLVVVTRWYGGIHLGPDRFKHINNCTRNLLEAHGFIRDKVLSRLLLLLLARWQQQHHHHHRCGIVQSACCMKFERKLEQN